MKKLDHDRSYFVDLAVYYPPGSKTIQHVRAEIFFDHFQLKRQIIKALDNGRKQSRDGALTVRITSQNPCHIVGGCLETFGASEMATDARSSG